MNGPLKLIRAYTSNSLKTRNIPDFYTLQIKDFLSNRISYPSARTKATSNAYLPATLPHIEYSDNTTDYFNVTLGLHQANFIRT